MNIVFCVDDHFTLPCAVALKSLAAANSAPMKIHVVSAQSPAARARIETLGARLGLALAIAPFDRDLPFHNVVMYGKATDSAYARIFIAEIFPELERCLYLDADILCRKPLDPLWNTALGSDILGAALDPTFFGDEPFLEIFGGRYFNSGVLLMDLARWREAGMTQRVVDAVHVFESQALPHQYWDQSPLNLAFRGAFRTLAPRWNMSIHHRPEMHRFFGCSAEDFEVQRADPAIFHFLGNEKPWRPGCSVRNSHFDHWHGLEKALDRDGR